VRGFFKGIVHQKKKSKKLSSFTHPHVPNDFLPWNRKGEFLKAESFRQALLTGSTDSLKRSN